MQRASVVHGGIPDAMQCRCADIGVTDRIAETLIALGFDRDLFARPVAEPDPPGNECLRQGFELAEFEALEAAAADRLRGNPARARASRAMRGSIRQRLAW